MGAACQHFPDRQRHVADATQKRRARAPGPDPPPSTPGLSPGTRVRQSPHCAASRNADATAPATA
ncbi:hypothetical protein XaplCFBP3122_04605 [Xanthomonas arboricola pv. populi]|uniref:Uncharacterized protein n=1 Tax=Xanthomonas arboricola pv. populi TaxID=487823 RepID=A0A2S6Z824_9XANT|nr:hypothetical protein XaplCFBP3122_04605 [Xanthomonas arboricola pv. populi]